MRPYLQCVIKDMKPSIVEEFKTFGYRFLTIHMAILENIIWCLRTNTQYYELKFVYGILIFSFNPVKAFINTTSALLSNSQRFFVRARETI